MIERGTNFFKRQFEEIEDGIIAARESGDQCFGVQTVFAGAIDRLIEKRRTQDGKKQPKYPPYVPDDERY